MIEMLRYVHITWNYWCEPRFKTFITLAQVCFWISLKATVTAFLSSSMVEIWFFHTFSLRKPQRKNHMDLNPVKMVAILTLREHKLESPTTWFPKMVSNVKKTSAVRCGLAPSCINHLVPSNPYSCKNGKTNLSIYHFNLLQSGYLVWKLGRTRRPHLWLAKQTTFEDGGS